MLLNLSQLLLGFVFLIKGADFLVMGAKNIAERFGIPSIVIGLSLVAFGTSTPELAVNIAAAFGGNSDLSLGNIIGSNIVNIALALGISAILGVIKVDKSTTFKDLPLSFLAIFVLLIVGWDTFISSGSESIITRGDGLVLLTFFVIFLAHLVISGMQGFKSEEISKDKISLKKAGVLFILGLIGIVIGGKLVVVGGIELGKFFGLSEAFIGLTVAAIGTSLPEIITSAVAIYRKEDGIAVGNIIGSNIFNIFLVLGVTAFISPLKFNEALVYDLGILFTITILLFLFIVEPHRILRFFKVRSRTLGRAKGIVLLSIYSGYVIFLFYRG